MVEPQEEDSFLVPLELQLGDGRNDLERVAHHKDADDWGGSREVHDSWLDAGQLVKRQVKEPFR